MINEYLKFLRFEMQQRNIDIYIVPSTDPHNSENVPECWARRQWISNFTGSVGEAIITQDAAYISTDGRYYLQCEYELDKNYYSLLKQTGFVPATESWLKLNAINKIIAIDSQVISIDRAEKIAKIAKDNASSLLLMEINLIDIIRNKLKQIVNMPTNQAYYLADNYTGQLSSNKIKLIQEELKINKINHLVITVLDEIAWLFNMRGSDISYCPLVISYAVVSQESIALFIDKNKLTTELMNILVKAKVKICDYASFADFLAQLQDVIWLDDRNISAWVYNKVTTTDIVFSSSPIIDKKACKNIIEQENARIAHIKDAVNLIKFFSWLNTNWQNGVTEILCSQKLTKIRQHNAIGESFPTISGFAENGAIIHYRASELTNKVIDNSNMYLIDSGGQYYEGTTDVTRTIHLGEPTQKQKEHYTRVLKGHLALSRTIFPKGTCGEHLDAIARMPLWQDKLNYAHGTGHGVGSFLCCHEGPQKISQSLTGVLLKPGMIVSNEPGLYLTGQYGIRIENLCLIKDVGNEFYAFDDLTLVPYAKNLIDFNLLDRADIEQLKKYYSTIKEKIYQQLNYNDKIWLENELNIFGDNFE